MKRLLPHRLTLLAAAGVLLLGGHGVTHGVTRPARAAQATRAGRELRIRAGRTVTLARENLRLRFVRVASDSRCPTGVNCVWVGNAEVLVEVGTRNRRANKTLRLNTNSGPERPAEDNYRGYAVRLVRLDPHPRANRKIGEGDYAATLLVTQSEARP